MFAADCEASPPSFADMAISRFLANTELTLSHSHGQGMEICDGISIVVIRFSLARRVN